MYTFFNTKAREDGDVFWKTHDIPVAVLSKRRLTAALRSFTAKI